MTGDLLAGARAALPPAGAEWHGHAATGSQVEWNIAAGFALRLAPHPAGIEVETDLPPWASIEFWLTAAKAAACGIEVECLAERAMIGDAFIRTIGDDGHAIDAPAQRLTLGQPGAQAASLPLDRDQTGRRRVLVVLSRPPARFLLTRLALDLT